MATQKELREHFLGLGKKGAIYVWGMNGQVITKALIEKLCKAVNSDKYDEEYYKGKLEEGEGKIGADCSGAIKAISGYDTTAAGYYNRCVDKGDISTLPEHKVCLVFKKNSKGKINHVGCYTGDGSVSEMASSKANYQRKPLEGNGWDLWGMPDFISDPDVEMNYLMITGIWNIETTYALQKLFGTKEDGEVSNQKRASKKYVPNASTDSWEFKWIGYKKGSSVIKALQEFLKAKGYYTGKIDGWCEKKTVIALQKFLKDLGYYAGEIDNKMGPGTVRALQQYVNTQI